MALSVRAAFELNNVVELIPVRNSFCEMFSETFADVVLSNAIFIKNIFNHRAVFSRRLKITTLIIHSVVILCILLLCAALWLSKINTGENGSAD